MYSNQPKILARPRSSLSTTEENRLKKSQQKPVIDKTVNTSKIVLSLIGLCVFLLVLCACVITFLVLVGRNLSNPTASKFSLRQNKSASGGEKIKDFRPHIPHFKPKVVFRPGEILPDSGEINKTDSSIETDSTIAADSVEIEIPSVTTTMVDGNENEMSMAAAAGNKIVSKVLKKLSFRLPKEVKPRHYDLFLHPRMNEGTFSGNVTIRLDILKPISFIPLHTKKLNMTETSVLKVNQEGDSVPVKILQTFEYEPHEYWITEFEQDLDVGQYYMKVSFNGNLTDRIVGFYRSSYYDPDLNETRWIATSKFEPTYARQAFPCFDEPDMKAPFKVSLVRPKKGYIALSNMDQKNEEEYDDDNMKVVFNEDQKVKMSTYLACFIVGDFKKKSKDINTNEIGKPFTMRVFATPTQVDKIDFALEAGVKITEYYIQYFKLEYPLPKLDMIAIPDFVSGAMEHWGLVTFRETALLYDEKESSTANKERVGSVVAHELAHMWFGNLVTMKWWNDLWLNEGFATYLSDKGVDNAYPSWKLGDRFIIDTMHGVMNLDATLASHQIVQVVENPDQITELFDSITYSKGASIIRMLEHYVGEDRFQKAVTAYLTEYKYNNAKTDDFLRHVNTVAPELSVADMMKTWTYQKGLPVITVKRTSEDTFTVTQKRFFANPEDEKAQDTPSEFEYKWNIPITYVTSKVTNKVENELFKYDAPEVKLNVNNDVEWIKLNKNQQGYYRVNYENKLWEKITAAIKTSPEVLSSQDRAHLLNDAFALANAGQLEYKIVLDLTTYLKNEKDYVPWVVATSEILFLRHILSPTDVYEKYVEYARKLLKEIYTEVGWKINGKDHLANLLRVTILSTSCALELPACVDEAKKQFSVWLDEPTNRPHPDIRSVVYSYGMRFSGDEKAWNQVWEIYKKETDANKKIKLMSSLAQIQVPWILKKYIDLAWDEKNVRGQDYFSCLQNIASNEVGESIVWDYIRDNWDKLVKRFGLNERYLGRMIPAITKRFATNIKLQEMENFFKKYPESGAGAAARKEALANVKKNIKWLDLNKSKIESWLNEQQGA